MPEIILTTINARYAHAAFGLRYLMANLGELQGRSTLLEFEINQRPIDIAETLLAKSPRIIGIGAYIWNISVVTQVIGIIKKVRQEITIILGGPEVSFVNGNEPIAKDADFIITGEADLAFVSLCRKLLIGDRPAKKIIVANPPDLTQLKSPYSLYTDNDIAHRVIYVEASRGCPFGCEFCLSSLPAPVRQIPLESLLPDLQILLDRGARQLKFVDRTFNLNIDTARTIMEFCLQNHKPGRFFHFEIIPDHLPDELKDVITRFPPGSLQLEIGVQSFNEDVCSRIGRQQDMQKTEDNILFLRQHANAHIHADLIIGLPGETLESFSAGFNRLLALKPHEIQVGILKRLPGAPIARHDHEWHMAYNPDPPYEILQNKLIDFSIMQTLRRFSRYWDLVGNSGNFRDSTSLIWVHTGDPFSSFMHWSEWLYNKTERTFGIALLKLTELLFAYLTAEIQLDKNHVASVLWQDYQRGGHSERPPFLLPYITNNSTPQRDVSSAPLQRQRLHSADL